MVSFLFRRATRQPKSRTAVRRPAQFRPTAELLEERALLSTFDVGPGQPYPSVGAVPWEALGAGDTVAIHWRPEAYHEKVLISNSGTAEQPIRVVGVAGPGGELPVLDGQNATSRPESVYAYDGTQERGLITIANDSRDEWGAKPSYIEVQGLDLRNADPNTTFTDGNGATHSYRVNAAALFVERGEHITVTGCRIADSANGLFVASGGEEETLSRDILVRGNFIVNNGTPGSYNEHNIYTEAIGAVFEYNYLGATRPGSTGNNLKDRSAGTVIRYNWIEPCVGHMLDLVNPEESSPITVFAPGFHETYVYGNVFNNVGPQSSELMIHYGGDNGLEDTYRKGTLFFTNNTVINEGDQTPEGRWRTVLLQLDTNGESADVLNNIFYTAAVTPGATPTELSFLNFDGHATFGVNSVSPGWLPASSAMPFNGTVTGLENLHTDAANDPGFVDLAGRDLHLKAGAWSVDRGTAVAAPHDVSREYLAPQAGADRPVSGAAPDLGAFEYVAATPVVPANPGQAQFSSPAYTVNEGDSTATIVLTRTGGSDGTLTVGYATAGGTASAGTDYTPVSGTLTFAAGETTKSFTVPVTDDQQVTGDKTVNLTLTQGRSSTGVSAVLTIKETDVAAPEPTPADATTPVVVVPPANLVTPPAASTPTPVVVVSSPVTSEPVVATPAPTAADTATVTDSVVMPAAVVTPTETATDSPAVTAGAEQQDVTPERHFLVVGADAGGLPQVLVVDAATHETVYNFLAYDAGFRGGVRVAAGDVNGDGTTDVITAPGPGGGPDVHVYDGKTGTLIKQFFAYDPRFSGGQYLASGDVNGDGYADVVVGADAGGGPNVLVVSGKDNAVLANFFAYGMGFTGGVRVAAGDVDGDGRADILTGAGPGGGPNVSVFSGADGSLLRSFFAYGQDFTAGVYVAAGDVNGDGRAEVVTGAGAGGGPNVAVFDGADGAALLSFFPYDQRFTGGVRVGVVEGEVVTTAGPGGGPDVRTVNGLTGASVDQFFAFDPSFRGGLFAGGR